MITKKDIEDMTLINKLELFRELWDNISYDDISSALGDLSDVDFNKLDDIIKDINNGDRCCECGHVIEGEDMITSTEHEEFWGAPCSYDIVIGYCCSSCGHHEVF